MSREGKLFSADDIKNKYTGINAPTIESKKLLEIFDEHNVEVEALVSKDYVRATLTKYRTIRSKVADFIKHKYNKENLFLEELDYPFISAFEKYLKVVESIENNTVMSYIKRVKRILTIAVNNKWIIQSPFTPFKLTTRKIARAELGEVELSALAAKEFHVKRLEEVRDCFLFNCYTGYAFVVL